MKTKTKHVRTKWVSQQRKLNDYSIDLAVSYTEINQSFAVIQDN